MYDISSITNIGSFEGAPITQLGEVLSAIMILLGGCIFGVPVAIVADSFGKMLSHQSGENDENKNLSVIVKQIEALDDEQKIVLKAMIDAEVALIDDKSKKEN